MYKSVVLALAAFCLLTTLGCLGGLSCDDDPVVVTASNFTASPSDPLPASGEKNISVTATTNREGTLTVRITGGASTISQTMTLTTLSPSPSYGAVVPIPDNNTPNPITYTVVVGPSDAPSVVVGTVTQLAGFQSAPNKGN